MSQITQIVPQCYALIITFWLVAFPMNFPLLHQVMVAGGLDPWLLHSKLASAATEKGSDGWIISTVRGSTGT